MNITKLILLLWFALLTMPTGLVSAASTIERTIMPVAKGDLEHHYEAALVKGMHQYRKDATGTAGVSAIEIDLGGSTDVSPTTKMYIAFRRSSEMRNTRASYYIGEFLSVGHYQRESAGIYSFRGSMFITPNNVQNVKVFFDTKKVWAEDLSREDFEDGRLTAGITVKIVPQ